MPVTASQAQQRQSQATAEIFAERFGMRPAIVTERSSNTLINMLDKFMIDMGFSTKRFNEMSSAEFGAVIKDMEKEGVKSTDFWPPLPMTISLSSLSEWNRLKTQFNYNAAPSKLDLPEPVEQRIAQIKQLPMHARLAEVKKFVDQWVKYEPDKLSGTRKENFETFESVMKTRNGDCEDFSMAYFKMAEAVGISPTQMMIVGGAARYNNSPGFVHSVLAVNMAGDMKVLDMNLYGVNEFQDGFRYSGYPRLFPAQVKSAPYLQADMDPQEMYNMNSYFALGAETQAAGVRAPASPPPRSN